MKSFIKKLIPQKLLELYHLAFAYGGAAWYRFPSRTLFVIGITGTKGKSTTSELVAAVLREAGHTVAVASTIHFEIDAADGCGNHTSTREPNLFKMTMPGRAYLQKFMRRAVDAGCTHAVIEMTSEGARQFRHKGIALDALVFTNLQPEHIESHGSLEAYAAAKLSLAQSLEHSPKRPRIMVANADDAYGEKFLETDVELRVPFSLHDADPCTVDDTSMRFLYKPAGHSGGKGELFTVPLPGLFNLRNILGVLALGDAMHISLATMKRALEHIAPVAGRAERVERGQSFAVVVDYAHTPDSLRALIEAYRPPEKEEALKRKIICIMGSTGGGRDQWKRPLMGKIADELCDSVYLTNEDPYDEDPQKIVTAIKAGFTTQTPHVVLDRREAVRAALKEAREGDVVLITGKGTDPYIMGPHGSKQDWSDKRVAEEELDNLLH
ncbi:MAG: UDP-N-acetylmuramoyl-L-alanyl-D-glutamate--2,6-diaminopimelate ligase [bacterium]